jgi:hypothetical protein
MEWKIGASTSINLARSFIAYNYTIAAGGAGNYGVVFEDGSDLFRNAYFGNGSGLGIVDLQQADVWKNLMAPYRTELEDFLTYDQLSGFYPSRQPAQNNIFPFSLDGLSAGTANASTLPWNDSQHLIISSQANTALNVTRYLPLNCLKDTMLGMDIDTVFGTDMYLRLWSNYGQRVAFYTNTPANPNSNITPIAAAFNLNNVYLYLAIEENLDIRNALLSSLARGQIKLSIPYTYCYRFTAAGNSATSNMTVTLTKSYGRALKRIVYAPYNAGGELTQYAFDHSNINGTKVKSIQSTLSGRPLTDYLVNCYNPNSSINPTGVNWSSSDSPADDWREIQKFTKGSCIQSYPHYGSQWAYMDCFGVPLTLDNSMMWKLQDGLDLKNAGDYIYSLQCQQPATQTATNSCYAGGFINYLYCTFLRSLVIQPDGIILEA